MRDFCPIRRIDHVELYVGNARQAAVFYATCLGFTNTAYRGLETGCRDAASYLMEQGISSQRLVASGKGEAQPLADNESESGRQQNRRVEVIIENAPPATASTSM